MVHKLVLLFKPVNTRIDTRMSLLNLTFTLLSLLLLSSACCSVQDTRHHPIIFASLKIACVIWNDISLLSVIPSS